MFGGNDTGDCAACLRPSLNLIVSSISLDKVKSPFLFLHSAFFHSSSVSNFTRQIRERKRERERERERERKREREGEKRPGV